MLLTGLPGVGKTTMMNRICKHYETRGLKIAGITTKEVREDNQRVGFRITDLATGNEGWLAGTDTGAGPRIGRYVVATEDLEKVGVGALERATQGDAGLIVVDEIGPMEMTNSAFRGVVSKILLGERVVVATLKYGSHYPEVERVLGTSVLLEITKENRDALYGKAIEQLNDWIDKQGS